jgi:nucleoside-diphosphate-sugar epimerase
MANIILTGSEGFLGTRLRELWGDQDKIIGVDIAGSPDYYVDLCDLKEFAKIVEFASPELVIHLGAYSHVIRSDLQPEKSALEILGLNVLSTYNVLQATLTECPVIIAGSAQEYGSWPEGISPPTENDPSHPEEPYGLSKYIGSLFVADRLWQKATILRFSNLYGPKQRNKFIPMVIENALTGKPLVLHGKGRQTRQFLYVDDAVAAIRASVNDARWRNSYNITHPEEVPIRTAAVIVYSELQNAALRTGRDLPLVDLKLQEGGGGASRVCMDPSLAMRELGWQPKISLEEGIRRTVNVALENKYAYTSLEYYSRRVGTGATNF